MYRILIYTFTIFTLLSVALANSSTNDSARPDEASLQAPRIVVAPTDQYSTEGFLEFVCRAEGNPQPVIQWYNASDDQLVIDRIPSAQMPSGIHVNQHYGRLMISNPTRGTLYTFYCNASNELGWTVSDHVVRGGAAYMDVSFRHVPQNRMVNEGENVTFVCEPPDGLPKPVISWTRNGKLIASQENNTEHFIDKQQVASLPPTTVTKDGHLHISRAQKLHSGHYICVARNTIAERQAPGVELTVKSSVTFIETPKHVRVRQGQTATFRCQTENNQPVHWKRGPGEGLLDQSRVEINHGQLVIRSVEMVDKGTYVCFVPGAGSRNATLTVDSFPSFVQAPNDLSVQIGQPALFQCIVQGHPKPSIYWELPDKTPIFPSEVAANQKYTVYPDGRLHIDNVQPEDEGKYQCTAHSSVDTIHSSAKLRVLSSSDKTKATNPVIESKVSNTASVLSNTPTSINIPVPFIGLPPCNQTRMAGESVLLTCDMGNQKPWNPVQVHLDWSVRWSRRTDGSDQRIENLHSTDSHRFRVLNTGNLQIASLQSSDSGLYTCIVQGTLTQHQGSTPTAVSVRAEWIAKLVVSSLRPSDFNEQCENIVLPSPKNLQAINVTATSTTLVWQPLQPYSTGISSTSHSTIAYWVEYLSLSESSNSWVTVERNWPMNTVYLAGLIPNTIYYFLVRSRWMNGRVGWASDPLGPIHTARTVTGNPSVSFPYFKHYGPSEQQTDLREQIKRVQVDHIQFHVLPGSQVYIQWSVTEYASLFGLITGFTIRAEEVGLLRCVGSILEQNGRVSSQASSIQSSQHYCSLYYSDSEGLAGMIYRLEGLQRLYTDSITGNSEPAVISTDVSSPRRSSELNSQPYQGTLSTLRPFQCYQIRISAYIMHHLYGKFESHPSPPKFVLTSERSPSAPPNDVSVSWISNTRAQIRWNAPIVKSWNGLLTGYVIQIYGELTQEPQIINVSHSILSIDVDLPQRPEACLIQVAAVTCAGVGVPSSPIRLVPRAYKFYVNGSSGFPAGISKPVELLSQPWFVGTMIGSIVAWCIIIALVAFFCFRKRYKKRKTHCAVLSTADNSRTGTNTANHECKAGCDTHDETVKMEPLLSETRQGGERGHNQVMEPKLAFVQSRSFAEYLVHSRDNACMQRTTDQTGIRRKHIDTPSNDSRTGGGTQSLSSSGGRSSNDALHQTTLVTSTNALSGSELVDVVGIPQSYSLSPSQYGWQSSPGSYPHDMLPPFQMSGGTPANLPYRLPVGTPIWMSPHNGSGERADVGSENLYLRSPDRMEDGIGATPYATASILSATEPHGAAGCFAPKIPLATICNAGAMCYPCGNAQSSSDQASYASNSERYRVKPNRGYVNGQYEDQCMTQSYAVHSPDGNTPSRKDSSSKASRSPTTTISQSSSKQQNKSHNTALTMTTTITSAEHSLTSSRVTPQEEELSTELQTNGLHNVQTNGPTGNNNYLPHSDHPCNTDWLRSSSDKACINALDHSDQQWNGNYPQV